VTEFGREYGEGLYALCAEENLDRDVLTELEALKQIFRENESFVKLLGNMTLSKEERVAIADATFKGQVHEYVLNFIKILVERGAVHEFSECISAYQACFYQNHQVAVAEVTTARPLTEAQREQLTARLKQMTGKEVEIKEKIDPSVMGGVLLNMDGKRYDNTVKSRLTAIKHTMTQE
jgi:F-type H+-transporting ATPase subunit delta